jgi:hypothetical protein
MKQVLFPFFLVLFAQISFAQQDSMPVYSSFTTKESRDRMYRERVDSSIMTGLSTPLTDTTEGDWNDAFWSMELILYRSDFATKRLYEAWNTINHRSEYFQKNLIELSYSDYPKQFKKQAESLLRATTSESVFIRCAEYILQADAAPATKHFILNLLHAKFRNSKEFGLTLLRSRIATYGEKKPAPPLKDIFSKNFLPGQTVIYSLQRKNRDYPGIAVIRKPDGFFVKESDSSLFSASQLARSILNYPYYITNGNTPQGIFRWTGFEVSKLLFIGPTPNIQMSMPYEASPSVFFDDSGLVNANWTKEMYGSLLPASWKNYPGMYESFFAGKMGRYAIIMHGTTVDPSYYKGQPYYPQTPSLGCLCSYEEWNAQGIRVKSNLQQIDDALASIGASDGYVVVIELNDLKKAVSPDDIRPIITALEKKLAKEQ